MKKPTEFFKDKRPWSKMKDAILGKYLVPYFAKVKKLGQVIIIIDGFADAASTLTALKDHH